eukprot:m.63900 g.63900  ORF g.63900 m.63900 type:complete len:837 (-) comp11978_c0_seq4:392-2902(-)
MSTKTLLHGMIAGFLVCGLMWFSFIMGQRSTGLPPYDTNAGQQARLTTTTPRTNNRPLQQWSTMARPPDSRAKASHSAPTSSWPGFEKCTPRLIIHCFTFDRPDDFSRLWRGLLRAQPVSGLEISIVIHVEYDETNSTSWQDQVDFAAKLAGTSTVHGPVTAIFAATHKGLKGSMLEAWSPTDECEFAMFLEDDIEVSEMLLVYSQEFIRQYGRATNQTRFDKVLGYKMYNQKWDEVNQRFEPQVNNRNQPFLIQEPCSWGTVFAPGVYMEYLRWFVKNSARDDPIVPHAWSNTWSKEKSAKKYLQRFMWERGIALVAINLPEKLSLTTVRMDVGTNIKPQWLGYLKERLEVPLLSREQHEELMRQSPSMMQFEAIDTLPVFNASHSQVSELRAAKPSLVRTMSGPKLPPKFLVDPLHLGGARARMVERAASILRHDINKLLCPQPRHQDLSMVDAEALIQMLTSSVGSGGAGLPLSIIENVGDRSTLYTLARMFLGPTAQQALVVETKFGLTNRMRGYASAKAIADVSMRFLVVIWEQDEHLLADMSDLFSVPPGVHVLNDGTTLRQLALSSIVSSRFKYFDLMDPAVKSVKINPNEQRHLFIRTAFTVQSTQSISAITTLNLRALTQHPTGTVEALIDGYYGTLPQGEKSHRDAIGIHIRMVPPGADADTPGISEEEALRMSLAAPYRVSCHYKFFIAKMLTLPQSTLFFVSADDPRAYDAVHSHSSLKGRVFHLDSDSCTSREQECMYYAAADLVLLSQTKKLLISKWSAFSETAARINGQATATGCDEPKGGWLSASASPADRRMQILDYLTEQHYDDISTVRRALNRYMTV